LTCTFHKSNLYDYLCARLIERYQNAVSNQSHALIDSYDQKLATAKDVQTGLEEANEAIAAMTKKETAKALDQVLYEVSCQMKNGFNLSDN
jgi:dipeptidase